MENVTQPTVLQHNSNANCRQYKLHIPANLIYFQGHFEELAILPGVTQIKWVIDFARQDLLQQASTHINKLKFMRPILPDQLIHLSIELTTGGYVNFKYHDDHAVYSQGQIYYD